MSAKSVATAVTGFLSHHIGDLTAIHSALSEIVSVVPIDSQDKERINSVLETVQNSASNINDFLNGNTVADSGEITVKESDLIAAVANFFASDAGKEALKSAEGNANA